MAVSQFIVDYAPTLGPPGPGRAGTCAGAVATPPIVPLRLSLLLFPTLMLVVTSPARPARSAATGFAHVVSAVRNLHD